MSWQAGKRRGHNIITKKQIKTKGKKLKSYFLQPRFVVTWDNVSFHRAALIWDWFTNHANFTLYLPPYSPFLNPIEELFSAWRWKVYDRQPHARMPLLQAMEEACGDIDVGSVQGWIRHARRYFPRCLARDRYCLWCGWGDVARCKQTARSLIHHPISTFLSKWKLNVCIVVIFLFYFLFLKTNLKNKAVYFCLKPYYLCSLKFWVDILHWNNLSQEPVHSKLCIAWKHS